MTDPRTIEFKPLADLKPDPRNPKAHDLETVGASIGRFGMVDPIVQDGRTGYIISGHGRTKVLTAMEEAGENPPEGVKVDAQGRWLVPVATGWSSRTDAEAGAALIALNRTTELGGWADDALLDLLEGLSESEDGFAGVGFDEADIAGLRTYLDAVVVSSFTEDEEEDTADDDDSEFEEASDVIRVSEPQGKVIVVYPSERRAELYGILEGIEWLTDVRDSYSV